MEASAACRLRGHRPSSRTAGVPTGVTGPERTAGRWNGTCGREGSVP